MKPISVREKERFNDAGLGDAFTGGFVHGDMTGKTPVTSAEIFAFLGSVALNFTGAIVSRVSIPNVDELL